MCSDEDFILIWSSQFSRMSLINCPRNRVFLVLIVTVFIRCDAIGQQVTNGNLSNLVKQYKSVFSEFQKKTFFSISNQDGGKEAAILKKFTRIHLNRSAIKNCFDESPGGIELTIPYDHSNITVELVKVDLFSDDFKVRTNVSGDAGVTFQPGIYYRGIVKGVPSSIASFSIFKNEMFGLIAYGLDNIVIGKLINGDAETDEYIAYADRDLKVPLENKCTTYDDPAYATRLNELLGEEGGLLRTNNCVRMYYEADYGLYQSNGSNLNNTINWITAVHNNVATLYSNDNIKTAISEIFIWTQPDPFTATTSVTQLNTFKSFRASFNGDVGQLLSLEPGTLGGIASAINGLCSSENKYCYSDVDFSFATVPAYSWTVNVVAHEFGHLLGAYHTHNCNWPGGAIDNCGPIAGFPNEGGSCPVGPAPIDGGTIMSYCHLTNFGINFNNGFGPLPADAIRSAIDASSCLSSSCVPNPPAYCLSKGQSTSSEWIQAVNLTTMNNISGPGPGYSDFTNHISDLQPGSVVSITLTPGYSGTHYDEIFTVWVDYNKDYDFYDSNEKVFVSQPVSDAVTGSFTVPSGLAGNTRMRISMKFDTASSTCESFKYGEVEDYTVSFKPLVTYCSSKGNITEKEWIDYVKLGAIERISSADNGYFDASSMVTYLMLNTVNTVTFSAGFSALKFNESWKGWIDYNGNGIFENNEIIFNKNSNKKGNITKDFTVPSTSSIGKTRMRISMKRGDQQASCDSFPHGEVEDYSIQIVPQDIGSSVATSVLPFDAIVYPNPATNEITAHFDQTVSAVSINLISLLGQVIYSGKFNEETENIKINVSSLLPGIYFMKIQTEANETVTIKWMKE